MNRLRRLPIRSQLMLMAMVTAVSALVLSTLAFVAWDYVSLRRQLRIETESLAEILGANLAAALAFDDAKVAVDTLRSLNNRPHMAIACVYDGDRQLFAEYVRRGVTSSCPSRLAWPPLTAGMLQFQGPVVLDGTVVGELLLVRDTRDVRSHVRNALLASLVVLAIAVAIAFALARLLQGAISVPLHELAEAAHAVSNRQDFSMRVAVDSPDELGTLGRAFNQMLAAVGESTTRLSAANEALRDEIDQRRRVEAEHEASLERERAANRLKDEFLATLSHELRTPLNAVLGWSDLLQKGDLDSEMRVRAVENVQRNARAQARLVEDLLDVSRIVRGRLTLAARTIDLRQVVRAALDVVRPAAEGREVDLAARLGPDPAWVRGDPDRLQQVVWNLLSNAVKFTPSSGLVSVTLDLDGKWALAVTDTGIGIAPEFLPFAFEAFRQADGSATRRQGGLGLGLAIVKSLVEMHGGSVAVTSEGEHRGTRVEVRLPPAKAPASPPDRSEPAPPRLLLAGVQALVVDDDPDAREIAQAALTAHGASVLLAASADEARVLLGEHPAVDVLLFDIAMPEEDGLSLLHSLRETEGPQPPAIAVSAVTTPSAGVSIRAAGFAAHVHKPVSPDELVAVVTRVLEHA